MSSYDLLARHARNVLLMQTKFCENATLAAVLSDFIPCQFFFATCMAWSNVDVEKNQPVLLIILF